MTDYGHELRFGVFIVPVAARAPEERERIEPLARHSFF